MPSEKRNTYLDAEEHEDDASHGYDSGADDLRKGGRSSKRREPRDHGEDHEEAFGGEEGQNEQGHGYDDAEPAREPPQSPGRAALGDGDEDQAGENRQEAGEKRKPTQPPELRGVSKPLSRKNLVASEAAVKKSGVIYISRVPPFLSPARLRALLQPYGSINRIYLAPEDPLTYSRRVRSGGNKRRSFTEGWVEFVSKKDAKKAVELLNVWL